MKCDISSLYGGSVVVVIVW